MSMVMPRAFSSGRRSQSMPVRALTSDGLAVVDVAGGAEDQVAWHGGLRLGYDTNGPRMNSFRSEQMSPARTLDDVLRSVSDVLFPEHLGEMPVGVGSRGVDGDTPLHVLAWRDDICGAELLIAAGADVNAAGDMGETPLHVAVAGEHVELVQLLLAAGGDPDLRSEFGETAREKAARVGGKMAGLFGDPADGNQSPVRRLTTVPATSH